MRSSIFRSGSKSCLSLTAFLVLVCNILSPLTVLANIEKTLAIMGWPTPPFSNDQPSSWLAGDPVVGRLICPTLSRLNLQRREAEPLVLKSVQIEQEKGRTVWALGVRVGIYWWSGKELSAEDIAHFFKNNISKIVQENGPSHWRVPAFDIRLDPNLIKIVWEEAPQFGPFILNDMPVWREKAVSSAEDLKFECVGRYVAQSVADGLILRPNKGYSHQKDHSLLFMKSELSSTKKTNGFDFVMADEHSVSLDSKKVFEKEPCACFVDLPLVSALIWTASPGMSTAVRKKLSSLIPREALRGIAAGYWATDISSLIPMNHPGYDKTLPNHTFVLTRAKERQPLFLSSIRNQMGLVEKVVSDNLLVGGFDIQFVSPKDPRVGGLLTGIFLPWPGLDLYDAFHSKGKQLLGRDKTASLPALDQLLEDYRFSLTQRNPDFSLLRKIHGALFEQEFVSVLMQHQACLRFRGVGGSPKGAIDVRDPDWFLDLLVGKI